MIEEEKKNESVMDRMHNLFWKNEKHAASANITFKREKENKFQMPFISYLSAFSAF